MSGNGKRHSASTDFSASENAQMIADRISFQLGRTTLQDRLQAIQSWVGGAAVMSDLTGISASGIKGWIGRGSQPGILAMAELSKKTGLSLDYIGTGIPRLAADFDCEEARLNAIVSSLIGTSTWQQMQFAGGEVVEHMRAEIRRARESATRGSPSAQATHDSDSPIATGGKTLLDHELLRVVIETVEQTLQSQGRDVAPAKKAELLLLAYSIMLDEHDTQQGSDKIIRLAKIAG